jgi:asparagine synthase (glutamine-hydrolysing)
MAHSVESRVPFLDHRLVEKTLTLQPDKLIRNGLTKTILRDAMKNLLPSEIAERKDKIGFESPNSRWLKSGAMKEFIEEILYSEQFVKRGYIESTKAQKAWINYLKGEKNIDKEIWKWINLELWFRNWIDKAAISE